MRTLSGGEYGNTLRNARQQFNKLKCCIGIIVAPTGLIAHLAAGWL
ncbi:hypothetical protein [Komagataeibacter saccharivorans]|nr:hypothetical protein [Komagataeibacter saccharivorans]